MANSPDQPKQDNPRRRRPALEPGARRPPHHSRPLKLAMMLAVIGALMWAAAAATRPKEASPAAPTRVAQPGAVPGVAGLTSSTPAPDASPSTTESQAPKRLIDQGAPAMFRLGVSFAAAFFLAWGVRLFAKMALLVSGAIVVLLICLQYFGILGIDWESLQKHFSSGMAFIGGKLENFRVFVMGYLPSAASAAAGAFFGFRHR